MQRAVVRPATEADLEAAVDLYEAVAAEGRWIGAETPVDREAALLARRQRLADGLLLVADAGEIVGELGLDRRGGVAYLGMHIAEAWRGRGVGRALLEASIAWAREQDFDKIALFVWPHNEAAIALYERLGFEREGYFRKHFRRRDGEPWDAVAMALLLRP